MTAVRLGSAVLLFAILVAAGAPLLADLQHVYAASGQNPIVTGTLSSVDFYAPIKASVIVSVLATLLALLWSSVPAWLLASMPAKAILAALAFPVLIPPIVVAYSFAVGIRLLGLQPSLATLVVALSFLTTPVCIFVLRHGFQTLDADTLAAGRNLGVGRSRLFRFVVVPHVAKSVALGLFAGMTLCWSDFYFSWFLGGLNQTISTKVYSAASTSITPQIVVLASIGALIAAVLVFAALQYSTVTERDQ